MKTACFPTDCSVDSALALRGWLTTHSSEAIRLTVVHTYDIEVSDRLTKESYRIAKQQAQSRLEQWLDMLPQSWAGACKPETLFSSPELALKMHLLLRSYDYLLVDDQLASVSADVDALLSRASAKLCRLTDYDFSRQIA
ncbi:hypothetical protein WBJ53_03400 [Spirosoma sp. SC4-14]|uniref:hypothetical protein n=1 Tax=Spirosoma sp. SC4-14 TaxID=3128900 RepID=UPI0030CF9833